MKDRKGNKQKMKYTNKTNLTSAIFYRQLKSNSKFFEGEIHEYSVIALGAESMKYSNNLI